MPEISAEAVQQAVTERQARFDYALHHVDEKVLHALQVIRDKGLKLGLISNASSSEVQAWGSSPLAEFFDVATFSYACGYVKPDPAIYECSLLALGEKAEHCLFVGDGGSDEHFGAHRAGMKPVLTSYFLDREEYAKRLTRYGDILAGEVACLTELVEEEWLE